MKNRHLLLLLLLIPLFTTATEIRVRYNFQTPKISEQEAYHLISFENTFLSGLHGEPTLPYQSVSLLLPPGEEAFEIEVIFENEQELDGSFMLFPRQYSSPISIGSSGEFIKNQQIYSSGSAYPNEATGKLNTAYLNGHSIALSSFTPVKYQPATGKITWYAQVDVIVKTKPATKAGNILANLSDRPEIKQKVAAMVSNPEVLYQYPAANKKSQLDMLIITPQSFFNGFNTLRQYYSNQGITSEIISPSEIISSTPGADNQEKIRNYIIQRYQLDDLKYVLLGGDVEHVPYRGFYCLVQSSEIYEEYNIPADLYYSGLDGTWNDNGNNKWGEPGEDDLLPDIAVARLPFSNLTEQTNMINKVYKYQSQPVINELDKNLLAGEHLYSNPLTWGGDYLDLLIGYQNENGYITDGIPVTANIEKMYDRDISYWGSSQIMQKINSGKTMIHHSGHSNWDYTMRLYNSQITDANFSQVNGINHNYCILYSHGCICGAFDKNDCIGENMLKIQNFGVAVGFNSRYGWFNEGQTEGPSQHLHREFVHSLYTLGYDRIGETEQHSKIRTAPWVNAPGQWEDGALRWCFYAHNILGDPAMMIYTDNLPAINVNPGEVSLEMETGETSAFDLEITNRAGQSISFYLTAEEPVKNGTDNGGKENTVNIRNIGWLSFDTDPNTLQPGQTIEMEITVNTSSVSAGTYNANLIVNSSDNFAPQIIIPVTLEVTSADILPGDANCDNELNIQDAVTIVNYIMGDDPQPFCFENADIITDGVIDLFDLISCIQIILDQK
ncbi:MAG: C25 family cysteine peptidase [Bacteroidales bacterium]